jgi:hypothetical protein
MKLQDVDSLFEKVTNEPKVFIFLAPRVLTDKGKRKASFKTRSFVYD